ncbi:hypothetical protein SDJN02_25023, partial [Cucurbita argyrosperma subsp. argyrosperma]
MDCFCNSGDGRRIQLPVLNCRCGSARPAPPPWGFRGSSLTETPALRHHALPVKTCPSTVH